MAEAVPGRTQQEEDRVSIAEANLLMVAAALALVGRKPHPVRLIGDSVDRWDAGLRGSVIATNQTVDVCFIGEPKPDDVRGWFRRHPSDVAWEQPIALLIVDGPRDRWAISRLFAGFEPWIVADGYLAFGEYDRPRFPDITDFVNELIDSRRYRKVQVAGTMAVIQKRPGRDRCDDCGPDLDQSDSHRAMPQDPTPRVLAATAMALRETLQRTAWIESRGELVDAERLELIRQLQTTMEHRTAWAERMVAEAEARGAVIEELPQTLAERTAWAERMVAEAEERGAVIKELQQALTERGQTQRRG